MNKAQLQAAEVRRLLQCYYQATSYPAGCTIGKPPYYTQRGMPKQHYALFLSIHKELMKRQVTKWALTEESVRKFEAALRAGRFQSPWQVRDKVCFYLDRLPHPKQEKEDVKTPPAPDEMMPRIPTELDLNAPRFRIRGSEEILENNRKGCWLQLSGDHAYCVLSGRSWPQTDLIPLY